MLEHGRAEPADRTLLDGDQDLMVSCQLLYQRRIQRLGKSRIDDRCRKSSGGEFVRRLQRVGQPGAERKYGYVVALPQHAAAAQGQNLATRRQWHADPIAAGVAQSGWPVV